MARAQRLRSTPELTALLDATDGLTALAKDFEARCRTVPKPAGCAKLARGERIGSIA